MGKLIYSAIASADGYVEDAAGNFDWSAPDEELHRFVMDLERPVGTYLYGRRMYETMRYWETAHTVPGQPALAHGLGAVERLADDVGVAGVLGGLGDHVQQHPACRPAGAGLEPRRRGQRMSGIEVGQLRY